MNKQEYMKILGQELASLGPAAVSEIMSDFEEHFANGLARGKTEDEITAELGNPVEIAQQYKESATEGSPARPVLQTYRYQRADSNVPPAGNPEPVRKASGKVNETALVLVIVLNIFFGIPIWISLFSTLFGLWAAAGGIGVSAVVLFTVAILQTGVISTILFLFGISMTALTILAIILMIFLTKWLIIGLSHYIRWNKKLVMGGNPA